MSICVLVEVGRGMEVGIMLNGGFESAHKNMGRKML